MFYSCEKSIQRGNPVLLFHREISVSYYAGQCLIIQFALYYLLSGRLQDVKKKGKFQTCSSNSGHGGL